MKNPDYKPPVDFDPNRTMQVPDSLVRAQQEAGRRRMNKYTSGVAGARIRAKTAADLGPDASAIVGPNGEVEMGLPRESEAVGDPQRGKGDDLVIIPPEQAAALWSVEEDGQGAIPQSNEGFAITNKPPSQRKKGFFATIKRWFGK